MFVYTHKLNLLVMLCSGKGIEAVLQPDAVAHVRLHSTDAYLLLQ